MSVKIGDCYVRMPELEWGTEIYAVVDIFSDTNTVILEDYWGEAVSLSLPALEAGDLSDSFRKADTADAYELLTEKVRKIEREIYELNTLKEKLLSGINRYV